MCHKKGSAPGNQASPQGQSKSVAAVPGIVRDPCDVRWGGAGAEARGSHQYRIHQPGERDTVCGEYSGTRHTTPG